jgi:hypothetical protein
MKKHGKLRRTYKIVSLSASVIAVAYLFLLFFPQPLFAYSVKYGNFNIHSREPIGPELETVLNDAEVRLRHSPIYDETVGRHIYLTNGYGMYAFLSHKAYASFANSVPFIENVFINKTDIAADRVYMNRAFSNSRSLSGVIAHEITHLFIQRRFGTLKAISMPIWKKEGYCEYIAGDSTITLEEGIRRWRENPADDTGYRYIKYHLMVKHLLEKENISVPDLFERSFDEKEIAERTFASLP